MNSNEKGVLKNVLNDTSGDKNKDEEYTSIMRNLEFGNGQSSYGSPYANGNKNNCNNRGGQDNEARSPAREIREELFDKFELKEKPNTITASPERGSYIQRKCFINTKVTKYEQSFYNDNNVTPNKRINKSEINDCNSKYRSKQTPTDDIVTNGRSLLIRDVVEERTVTNTSSNNINNNNNTEYFLEEAHNYGRSVKNNNTNEKKNPSNKFTENNELRESIDRQESRNYQQSTPKNNCTTPLGRYNNSKRQPSKERQNPETRGMLNHSHHFHDDCDNCLFCHQPVKEGDDKGYYSPEKKIDRSRLEMSRDKYKQNLQNSSGFERRNYTNNLEDNLEDNHEYVIRTPTNFNAKSQTQKTEIVEVKKSQQMKTPKKEIIDFSNSTNGAYTRKSTQMQLQMNNNRTVTPKSSKKPTLFNAQESSIKKEQRRSYKKSNKNLS